MPTVIGRSSQFEREYQTAGRHYLSGPRACDDSTWTAWVLDTALLPLESGAVTSSVRSQLNNAFNCPIATGEDVTKRSEKCINNMQGAFLNRADLSFRRNWLRGIAPKEC
jgi:hypothetical protein